MLELACENVVFHFNKKHLTDDTIPMWVVKTKGESYYVEHVTCNVPWSTKETPDNAHTKGSIKIKDCVLRIGGDNHAIITQLTDEDKIRLGVDRIKPIRILFGPDFKDILTASDIKYSDIATFYGTCGERYHVCDLLNEKDLMYLTLKYNTKFRTVKENEDYYDEYEEKIEKERLTIPLVR